MKINYWKDSLNFDTKNCAILWTNGAGKSYIARAIFNTNKKNSEIITSQKNLTIYQGNFKGKSDENLNTSLQVVQAPWRWSISLSHSTISTNNRIQDDFDANLEAILRNDEREHAEASREYDETSPYNRPKTKAEKIFEIWWKIFINKTCKIINWKIKIVDDNEEYDIENLSDGERACLYFIIKCMCFKENSIIIVDEWETYLNHSILTELWDFIEAERLDCSFVYISHNIDFVQSRINCTKFRIKSFNYKDQWEIEKLENEDIPEDLILQIIWSKKDKILFVESVEDYDKKFYQKIYKDFKVVSVGSCENVINYTRTLKKFKQNYNKEYYWLIDKDFRDDNSISKLNEDNIHTIPFALFENIFFKKEILQFFYNYQGKENFDEKFEEFKKDIFSLKKDNSFKKIFYKNFIIQSFNKSLKNFNIGNNYEFKDNYYEINEKWGYIEKEKDYNNFLEKVNTKGIKGKIGQLLEWYTRNLYINQVIDLFNTEISEELRQIFMNFMPKI